MRILEPKAPLEALDPGRSDPGYWRRFQRRVMAAAEPHLAHRRGAAVTMESVMVSWSRMVLPTMAAAAVAAIFLLGDSVPPGVESFAGVEEVLDSAADSEGSLPSFLHSDELVDRDAVLFAVESY